MRIIVIGAGFVGLSTACALAADGHDVTCIETLRGPAQSASFGASGYIGPSGLRSFVRPLSFSNRVWLRFSSTNPDAPLRYGVGARTQWASFVAAFTENCTETRSVELHRHLIELSERNLTLLESPSPFGLSEEERLPVLHVLRDRSELENARFAPPEWFAGARAFDRLDHRQCRLAEPGIEETASIAGALRTERDYTVNAAFLARKLALRARELDVDLRYGQNVCDISLETGTCAVTGVRVGDELIKADAVVLASGADCVSLLGKLWTFSQLPVAPLTLCSMLAEVHDHALPGLRTSLIDETMGIAMCGTDRRIRIAGSPILGELSQKDRDDEYKRLYDAAMPILGGAVNWRRAQYWSATCLATPDAMPIVGQVSQVPGLFLNIAHGNHGIATGLACAEIISLDMRRREDHPVNPAACRIERFFSKNQ